MASEHTSETIKASLEKVDLEKKRTFSDMQTILESACPEFAVNVLQQMFNHMNLPSDAQVTLAEVIDYVYGDETKHKDERFWSWLLDMQCEESHLFPRGMDLRVLRQNSLTKRWTLYVNNKSGGPIKPKAYAAAPRVNLRAMEQPAFDTTGRCPFCPGTEPKMTPAELCRILPSGELQQHQSYPDQEYLTQDWLARAVRNKFPYLAIPPDMYAEPFPGDGPGALAGELDNFWTNTEPDNEMYPQVDGFGASEVIIESPLHNAQLAVSTGVQIAHSFRLLAARGRELRKHPSVKQLVFFKQYGVTGGGSLVHPHMQVHTLPIISGYMETRLKQHRDFFDTHGCCAVERVYVNDVISTNSCAKVRLVRETNHFVASVPYAAAAKGRMVIAPKRHVQCFEDSTDEELFDLGALLQLVMSTIYRLFDDPDYNVYWETCPTAPALAASGFKLDQTNQNFRWTMHVRPSRSKLGITNASGVEFTDNLPEIKAKQYRDAIEEELASPLREGPRTTELDQLKGLLCAKEKEVEDLRKRLAEMEGSK